MNKMPKISIFLFCIVFLFFGLVSYADAATYYVDATLGLDTNDGLFGTTGDGHGPWQTITKVNGATLVAGDSVLFKKGETWNVKLVPKSGEAGNPITYGAYGTGNAPIISASTDTNDHAVLANGKNYVTIQDMDLRGGDGNGAVTIMGASTGLIIQRNTITNDVGKALYITTGGVTEAQILNNTIITTDLDGIGIYVNAADVTISGNTITNTNGTKTSLIGIKVTGVSTGSISSNVIGTSDSDGYNNGISIDTATGLTINGNTIVTNGTTGQGIITTSGSQTIFNNTITNTDATKTNSSLIAIYLNGASNSLVYNNTIGSTASNSFYDGIKVSNGDSNQIYGNTISYAWNCLEYPDMAGAGIRISNSSAANQVYKNNLLESQIQDGVTSGNGGNSYYYNIVKNAHVNSIDFRGQSTVNASSILNNVIIHHPSNGAGHGIDVQISGKKVIIKNNIVVSDSTGNNIQAMTISGPYTSIDINNNLYHLTNGAVLGKLGSTEYTSIESWRAALASDSAVLGYDNSAISIDPEFVDADSDYRLSSSSSAINAGTDVGLTTDYAGNAIMGSPDIGAYEYQWVSPVSAFSSSVSDRTATFTDSSTDSDGTIASWSWDFGDGSSSTSQNPEHAYAENGSYTATLAVIDNHGAQNTTTASVPISYSNPSGGHRRSVTNLLTSNQTLAPKATSSPLNIEQATVEELQTLLASLQKQLLSLLTQLVAMYQAQLGR